MWTTGNMPPESLKFGVVDDGNNGQEHNKSSVAEYDISGTHWSSSSFLSSSSPSTSLLEIKDVLALCEDGDLLLAREKLADSALRVGVEFVVARDIQRMQRGQFPAQRVTSLPPWTSLQFVDFATTSPRQQSVDHKAVVEALKEIPPVIQRLFKRMLELFYQGLKLDDNTSKPSSSNSPQTHEDTNVGTELPVALDALGVAEVAARLSAAFVLQRTNSSTSWIRSQPLRAIHSFSRVLVKQQRQRASGLHSTHRVGLRDGS
ncbi:hypothetical protein GQ600_11736 [Phytophthora cactorum]|nr:hypothetical protein GQ600_11736 [Phytophthora cactorum]